MDALSTQIASRRFDIVKRGYDTAAVESYLRKIGDQVAKLEDALRVTRTRLEELERRSNSFSTSSADTVVKTAFLAAADSKAKLIAEAEARASEIIAEAERKAASISGGSAAAADVESMLMEARRRLEDAEHAATARREAAEREAVEIIAQARARVAEGDEGRPVPSQAAAADELTRLVETLSALKRVARGGADEATALGADIEAVIGDR
jgi:DivIVA domain-containing protein